MITFIFISTGWGAEYGGINSFNYDLCLAVAQKYKEKHKVISVTRTMSDSIKKDAKKNGIELIGLDPEELSSPNSIIDAVQEYCKYDSMIYWIGHDIKTGAVACECSKRRGDKFVFVHHMDYVSYYAFKSNNGEEAAKREQKQIELLKRADFVFAVGPLLRDSARKKVNKEVNMIIPGLAEMGTIQGNDNKTVALTFGRVEKDNDIIKQTKLAIAAFSKVYGENAYLFEKNRPMMRVIGCDSNNSEEYKEIIDFASGYSKKLINILPIPYTKDRKKLFEYLQQSGFCLMLSYHEGFGLTGYEAISVGLPLICSVNSGLYKFLDQEVSPPLSSWVHGVKIDGRLGEKTGENYSDKDLENVTKEICSVISNYDDCMENAKRLRERLYSLGYTWEKCAERFISTLLNQTDKKQNRAIGSETTTKYVIKKGRKLSEFVEQYLLPTYCLSILELQHSDNLEAYVRCIVVKYTKDGKNRFTVFSAKNSIDILGIVQKVRGTKKMRPKNYGVIGTMNKVKVPIFYDFENKECYALSLGGNAEKIACPKNMGSKDKRIALMVAPMFYNNEIVGVLSFDFFQTDLENKNILKRIKKDEKELSRILYSASLFAATTMEVLASEFDRDVDYLSLDRNEEE